MNGGGGLYSSSNNGNINSNRGVGGGLKTWLRRLSRFPQMVSIPFTLINLVGDEREGSK